MKIRAFIVAMLMALAFLRAAGTQVKGLIVGPGAERYPIAISPLRNLAPGDDSRKLSEGIADTIVRDLNLSGWFKVLDRSAYLENPQTSGVTLGSFDFKSWSVIGAEGLVKGSFTVQGEDLTVELRLFDVYQGKQVVGKRYTGTAKDYRRIAHRFADEIIFQFTGVQGVFNTRIAYVSTSGGRFKEIYVSHLDGSERIQVTNNRTINLSPSWSPDGRSILYTSYKEGNPSLFLFDLFSGKDVKFSSRTGLNLGAKWSPTGKQIAVTLERQGNTDIYLLDSSGNVVRRLTEYAGIDVSPTWSPDGRSIAFVSDRSGGPQIYIMDVDSGKTRRLTFAGGYNTSPDWSPKGDRIAYTSRVGGRFHIMTTAIQGGEPQDLTPDSGNHEDPSWSPDGRYIAFSSNRKGPYNIYIMQSTGENQQRLTASGGDDRNPSWSPRLE
ncbi:MAG TPA: Tol-Pal system beta propeller repeat protein TolB [Candidatus Binatia bacterium]|jgi:TolB protein|nr:Tol-Pal system beta propeller repeat protein TolB [Candidatus Binatia bacterium]